MIGFEYWASPYSAGDPEIEQARYEQVERAAVLAIKQGVPAFSPIAYTHHMAVKYMLPRTHDFWRPLNHPMLLAAKRLVIVKLPGWPSSKGLADELALAEANNIPVKFQDPPPE